METSALGCLSWVVVMGITAGVSAFSPHNGDDITVDGLPYSVQNADRPWSIQNPEPGILRFELSPGDLWYQDPPTKERSEIAGDTVYAAGKDITIHYDFQVAPGPENTSDWLVIGQLHATDEFSRPIFAVELIGERLAIQLRYKLPGEQYQEWFAFIDDDPIVRGKYYHVEAHLHTHIDDRGSVDVWLNGEHVVDYSGYIGYGYGVYWKEGIYRAASPETMIVEYSDLYIEGEVGVRIEGTPGDDTITPKTRTPGNPSQSADGDIIEGREGADLIWGGLGPDLLFGGEGDDTLHGRRNDDTLIGGPGDDRLTGGRGHDLFRFEENTGRDVVSDFHPGKDLIAVDHHLFKSESDLASRLHKTERGAVLEFEETTILFRGTSVREINFDDLLLV
jgi:Ca2+-binding RTX toxin-like protein